MQTSLFERLLMLLGWTELRVGKRRNLLALRKLTDAELSDLGLARSEVDGRLVDARQRESR